MTILNRLSDRDGFIYDVISIIVKSDGNLSMLKLQRALLSCGVYVKKPLLEEAVKTMMDKGLLTKPNPIKVPEKPKIILP